jgi:hypothetical protein
MRPPLPDASSAVRCGAKKAMSTPRSKARMVTGTTAGTSVSSGGLSGGVRYGSVLT